MLSREKAIEVATDAALQWYAEGDELEPVDFIEASQESNGDWLVVFKVYGWLTSEWRVWEYKGKPGVEIIGG